MGKSLYSTPSRIVTRERVEVRKSLGPPTPLGSACLVLCLVLARWCCLGLGGRHDRGSAVGIREIHVGGLWTEKIGYLLAHHILLHVLKRCELKTAVAHESEIELSQGHETACGTHGFFREFGQWFGHFIVCDHVGVANDSVAAQETGWERWEPSEARV